MKQLLIILLSLSSPNLFGEDWSPRDASMFVRKCYAQLTSRRIPSSSSYLTRAASGEDPVNICMSILSRGNLGGSNAVADEEKDSIGQKVLDNMHKLHVNFFTNRLFENSSPQSTQSLRSFFDNTQPAMFITDALFKDKAYSSVVTENWTPQAIREDMDPQVLIFRNNDRQKCNEERNGTGCGRYIPVIFNPNTTVNPHSTTGSCNNNPSQSGCDYYKNEFDLTNPFAPRGKLLGIRQSPGYLSPHGGLQHQGGTPRVPEHKDFSKNLGGGLLGDVVFIMNTLVDQSNYKADGSLKVPRHWSKAIYEDVLCRQLPALRPSDVGFQLSTNDQSASFRWSTSCLTCHVSMDQTAGNLRNLQYISMGSQRNGTQSSIVPRIKPWTVSSNKAWSELADTNWHNSQPLGRIFYRDYKGEIVHETTENIDQLGEAISKTDDYYICAAKNYFKHFVSVDVSLADPGAVDFVDDAPEYKEELVKIGLRFKKHQSLRKLIEDIFRSPFYFKGEK